MGIIYKIVVAGEIYIGSTKQKLYQRQSNHNKSLRNPNCKDYNNPLYIFCREHNIKKIICELIETVDNDNIFIKEQEYIDLLNPTINSHRAFRTEEQRIEQQKENRKKHNKIKANCPQCGMLMVKGNINRHIRNIH
jgi:hypothetical protein